MTTKETEFDLMEWFNDFSILVDLPYTKKSTDNAIIGALEAGYYKGREIERKAVLEEVRKAFKAETDPDSWGAFAKPTVEKILNRLGGEK